jgi:hypothetical protein
MSDQIDTLGEALPREMGRDELAAEAFKFLQEYAPQDWTVERRASAIDEIAFRFQMIIRHEIVTYNFAAVLSMWERNRAGVAVEAIRMTAAGFRRLQTEGTIQEDAFR